MAVAEVRGERQEATRAARAVSIHKKMQTVACLVLVTRHNHIKEIVPQIVPRIVPETSSKNAIFFGGFRYYFGTICGTRNSTQNSTKIILQQNGPQCILKRKELLIPNHFSSSLNLICTWIYRFSKSEMSKNR
jgi:hypothetical protein